MEVGYTRVRKDELLTSGVYMVVPATRRGAESVIIRCHLCGECSYRATSEVPESGLLGRPFCELPGSEVSIRLDGWKRG